MKAGAWLPDSAQGTVSFNRNYTAPAAAAAQTLVVGRCPEGAGNVQVSESAEGISYQHRGLCQPAVKDAWQLQGPVGTSTCKLTHHQAAGLQVGGELSKDVESLELLVQQGFLPPTSLLYSLLKRCIARKDLVHGKRVHALAVASGNGTNPFVGNHIIRMYSCHGMLVEAMQVFTELDVQNTFAWASIIIAHADHGQPSQAIKLYRQMRLSCLEPNQHVFVAAIKACANAGDLVAGKDIHSHIVLAAYERQPLIANSLVNMYSKCGSLADARQVFDKSVMRDVVTWNTIIAAYAHHGHSQEALRLYKQMQLVGTTPPNHFTYASVLKACASIGAVHEGRQLHLLLRDSGMECDVFVGSCLVDMYAKCGSLEDARTVFDKLPKRNVVTWNALIAGYAHHGLAEEAFNLFALMQQEGSIPLNRGSLASLAKACASARALHQGRWLHALIQKEGLESDLVVANCLLDMYAKCGSLEDARAVFEELPTRDVIAWNTMITGYSQNDLGEEALHLYARMQCEVCTPPNHFTFAGLLKACASTRNLHRGMQMHALIQERGLEGDVIVGSSLVDMYAKCGGLELARQVFDRMPARNVVTWTSMIAGYAQHGLGQEALHVFASMQQQDVRLCDRVTLLCLLKACTCVEDLHQGVQVHMLIQDSGLETDLVVGSSLVDMYAKCGSLNDARRVFDKLSTRDAVAWTAMIAGYARQGHGLEALTLYATMQDEGLTPANHATCAALLMACGSLTALSHGKKLHSLIQERGLETDVAVGNCLVDMYVKCGSLMDARSVFDKLSSKDLLAWNALIAGYCQQGLGQEALDLHEQMRHECKHLVVANHVTYVWLLKACASVGALHQGRQLHRLMAQAQGLETEVVVGNCLVDMYARCGCLEDARKVLDRLPYRDVVAWNALLNGYAKHSEGHMALQCFEEMLGQGVKPDGTSFCSLLVACSHEGLISEGQHYFTEMVDVHGIEPTDYHYNCMVDLLGRSGCLDEAEQMLHSVATANQAVGLTSLLSACKFHGDVERGRMCFERLTALCPQDAGAYVLMGNIYASAGRWDDVERMERLRKRAGALKKPAKACIEVKGKVHEFTVGDMVPSVVSKSRSTNSRIQEEGGHVPHRDLVLRSVSDSMKEDALCGHAEKLALAYGLLHTPDGTSLMVTKNLRMCSDCHSSTKVLSQLEKRQIVVRDAHRVHRFLDGHCSCRDRC